MTDEPIAAPSASGRDDAWLTPGVRGIGAASLLSDLGHEVPTALLPSLLTSTLGAPAAALGVIEGVSDGLAGAARLGGGALADDPERRRAAAVGGYTATAGFSSLIGAATAVWQVALLRAAAWTSRGVAGAVAERALLADGVMGGRALPTERCANGGLPNRLAKPALCHEAYAQFAAAATSHARYRNAGPRPGAVDSRFEAAAA
jgi:hypothetical protein